MKGKTILIINDEKDLVDIIESNLHREEYRTLTAFDGLTGYRLAVQHKPNLVLMDLILPKKSGQEVIVSLKADPATRQIPIVILTAESKESDIVIGLALGADDYITKPFSIKVLQARIGAVLRRFEATTQPAELLSVGDLSVDRSRHLVHLDSESSTLTLTEFRILEALILARGQVLNREQLLKLAFVNDATGHDRSIDVHIAALRKKLGHYRHMIETIRGVGYRFSATRTER